MMGIKESFFTIATFWGAFFVEVYVHLRVKDLLFLSIAHHFGKICVSNL
jgi:hypothetical protein